ncbi:MAG: hypothetical protein ACRDTC_14860, partial [Pseudonocardiaceae bacterium]
MPASDPGLYEWLALRRVHDGGVAKVAGVYLERGRPTPEHLTDAFDRLVWTGLVTVAEGDVLWDLRRLNLTDTGQARYTTLNHQRPTGIAVPAPEFTITQTPVGHQSSLLPRLPATDRAPHHERPDDALGTPPAVRAGGPTDVALAPSRSYTECL